MTEGTDYIALADWRRRVASLYADVRAAPEAGRKIAWDEWRAARNDLLRDHPQSPLSADQRRHFRSLRYVPFDPAWRILAEFQGDSDGGRFVYQLGNDGEFTMKRIGWAHFRVSKDDVRLALYWIEGYGGGLFLPFKDATNGDAGLEGDETYGSGRYLLDTIKGADLGVVGGRLVLDFNYSYNPSCAYHPRWVCPLAPAENQLSFPIRAGEKRFDQLLDPRLIEGNS